MEENHVYTYDMGNRQFGMSACGNPCIYKNVYCNNMADCPEISGAIQKLGEYERLGLDPDAIAKIINNTKLREILDNQDDRHHDDELDTYWYGSCIGHGIYSSYEEQDDDTLFDEFDGRDIPLGHSPDFQGAWEILCSENSCIKDEYSIGYIFTKMIDAYFQKNGWKRHHDGEIILNEGDIYAFVKSMKEKKRRNEQKNIQKDTNNKGIETSGNEKNNRVINDYRENNAAYERQGIYAGYDRHVNQNFDAPIREIA